MTVWRSCGRRMPGVPPVSRACSGSRSGVRHAGDHRADDLVFLAADRLGQADQLGDVVMPGAPGVEGNSRSRTLRSHGVEPVTRARRFSASRSFSFTIHAAARCCAPKEWMWSPTWPPAIAGVTALRPDVVVVDVSPSADAGFGWRGGCGPCRTRPTWCSPRARHPPSSARGSRVTVSSPGPACAPRRSGDAAPRRPARLPHRDDRRPVTVPTGSPAI